MENGIVTADFVIESAVRASGYSLTAYQRAFLADRSHLRAVLKARQTGFSWLFALEALAGALAEGQFSIFVSLNREEAREKILYARDLYESLPAELRPKLIRGGSTELRFENGGRLLSFPCRSPRGKARATVYLDEMAFYPHSEAVYSGALPVVSHGGRITLASTPAGEKGAFWTTTVGGEMAGQFSQHRIPWWRAPWLVTDLRAAESATDMETSERVERFGSDVLKRIFGAMERDSFRQEYELQFTESGTAFMPRREIDACVDDGIVLAENWAGLAGEGGLYAGADIGRINDATEIVVIQARGNEYTVRLLKTMVGETFENQEAALSDLMKTPGVQKLHLDRTGLGYSTAEVLQHRFPGKVNGVDFTNPRKHKMAMALRQAIQGGRIHLPRRQSFLDQLHAVRREITSSGAVRYEADRDGHSHADQFWALALAIEAAESGPAEVRATRL